MLADAGHAAHRRRQPPRRRRRDARDGTVLAVRQAGLPHRARSRCGDARHAAARRRLPDLCGRQVAPRQGSPQPARCTRLRSIAGAGRQRVRQLGSPSALSIAHRQGVLVRGRPRGDDAARVLLLEVLCRPRTRLSARGPRGRSGSTVLPLSRLPSQSHPAAGAARDDRPLPRPLRRRLGGAAQRAARPCGGARADPYRCADGAAGG